jgi:hypothetical protein
MLPAELRPLAHSESNTSKSNDVGRYFVKLEKRFEEQSKNFDSSRVCMGNDLNGDGAMNVDEQQWWRCQACRHGPRWFKRVEL